MESNNSISPKCQHFGKCGGCACQHIAYETQVENKRKVVENAIKNSGIEFDAEVGIESDKDYYYRNRMDFVFSQEGLSFRKKGCYNRLVPIKDCVISNQNLNKILKEVQSFFESNIQSNDVDVFDINKKIGSLRYAVIRAPEFADDSSVSFVLNSDSTTLAKNIDAIKQFSKNSTVNNIVVTYAHKDTDISTSSDYFIVKGKDIIHEKISGKLYYYSVQGFMQNNSVMAQKMVEHVKSILPKNGAEKRENFFLDLYGGVGLFGIGLSKNFKNVLIVESLQESIDCANKNIEANNLTNVKALCLDAKQIQKLDLGENPIVLTDPPRSGMHPKTIKYLLNLCPKEIIYVSCNPKQLSKELVYFRKKYFVSHACAFDLFPQTNHVESVVCLKRKEK